jgi:hypothetical protein
MRRRAVAPRSAGESLHCATPVQPDFAELTGGLAGGELTGGLAGGGLAGAELTGAGLPDAGRASVLDTGRLPAATAVAPAGPRCSRPLTAS